MVPAQSQVVPQAEPDNSDPLYEIVDKMQQQVQNGILGMLQLNLDACIVVEINANHLYDCAAQLSDDPVRLLSLKLMTKYLSCLAPLVRVSIYQQQGDFEKCHEECSKGRDVPAEGLDLVNQLEQKVGFGSPEMEQISFLGLMFEAFSNMFIAVDLMASAEELGYQGRIADYVKGVEAAIAIYKKAAEVLRKSANDFALAMERMFRQIATNLEIRARFFKERIGKQTGYLLPNGDKILIIHGHDKGELLGLRQLLQNQFGLKVVVVKDEPNLGRGLIDKFEDYGNECCYAFVLLTPDDFVEKEGHMQARPNVFFELGWFYGRFGPRRLCILKKADTAIPSDLRGIVTIDFKEELTEKFLEIRRELEPYLKPGPA